MKLSVAEQRCWEIFRSTFQNGDEVVVEVESGEFYCGKLVASNEHITLTRPGGWSKQIAWQDIELVAHDGFPVRGLRGMTPEEAALRAQQTDSTVIRAAFDKVRTPVIRGGGCPFVAGPMFHGRIFNINSPHQYGNRVETMEFVAPDGAVMHSYDTEHMFLLTG